MIHNLKLVEGSLDAIVEGVKPFEIRYGDRPYQVGDTLWLIEIKERQRALISSYMLEPNANLDVTGRVVIAEISYVLTRESMQFTTGATGLRKGFVALGLAHVRVPAPRVANIDDLRRAVGLRVRGTGSDGGSITAKGGWVAPGGILPETPSGQTVVGEPAHFENAAPDERALFWCRNDKPHFGHDWDAPARLIRYGADVGTVPARCPGVEGVIIGERGPHADEVVIDEPAGS